MAEKKHHSLASLGKRFARTWGKTGEWNAAGRLVDGMAPSELTNALLAALVNEVCPPPGWERRGKYSMSQFGKMLALAEIEYDRQWGEVYAASLASSRAAWAEMCRGRAPVPRLLLRRVEGYMLTRATHRACSTTFRDDVDPSCFDRGAMSLCGITGKWWEKSTATFKAYQAWQRATKNMKDRDRRRSSKRGASPSIGS